MMRFTCVLHENTLYFNEKKCCSNWTLFSKKTALFAVFQCDFDANVATSTERANDVFYMCIRVHQIAMLNFVLNISICLGLHFVLTQIKMTWAKIRQNSLIFRGATEHLKNMKMDRFGCFPRKLKIMQEIVYENIYFQKNNINLLLYKFKN